MYVQSTLRRRPGYRTLERDLIQNQQQQLFQIFVVVSLRKGSSGNTYSPEITQQFPKMVPHAHTHTHTRTHARTRARTGMGVRQTSEASVYGMPLPSTGGCLLCVFPVNALPLYSVNMNGYIREQGVRRGVRNTTF